MNKPGKNTQILFVDHNRLVRDSAAAIFAEQGYQTVAAEDGFDALCRLAEQPPGIIFMATSMPRLDGFQSCALIRTSKQFASTPIVLLSSDYGPLEKARAELAGANRFLQKPFSRKELLSAVEELSQA
ncbi:MAG: response regulator [Pseudomonadales bacterium]|nr:response regulator [Pseudomonadales bacterium]